MPHQKYVDDTRRVYSPVPSPSYHNGRSMVSSDMYTYTTDTNVTDSEYANRAGCGVWAKYGIFTANIVFLIVGGLLLAMGVWLRTDSRFRNFISERYRQAVQEAFWEAPTLFAFSYIIIVLGAVMMVVAMLGCCGITGRSRPFLIIYSMVVFLLLVATLSCGIYLLYKKDGLDVELSDALNYMVQHYYQGPGVVQESLDHLQTAFRCCGNAGCSDFRVFRQDIPRSCDIRCDGCHFRIMIALRIGFSVTLIVFSAVVLCQVLTICFALYFVFMREKEVKIIYVEPPHRRHSHRLTRDTLRDHDLPFQLQPKKPRRYASKERY
ncbi:Tetraspanin [Caenorhabditis elegans]|uniref:Tetraspanin n=1 Tax=Caenorhabditis elegans TaxID=6239 RepID=Q9NET3_CAEEL|nr:Tetraspanin [Caenorhabditis elegans]CAC51071.1 Tetraspanin [Caenorhabditis elegans]|eukprot:NP_741692.1 Tetraspanin [Caenorhabditis elegans]